MYTQHTHQRYPHGQSTHAYHNYVNVFKLKFEGLQRAIPLIIQL
jgi:hypothetical protein